MIQVEEKLSQCPAASQWKGVGIKFHHGINLPLFSLRSRQSCGIGEYTDLLPLVDWCKRVGMDVIQLLPLNDGGPERSPYAALSAFALNPLNLGLASLPYLELMPDAVEMIDELQKLNALQRIAYPIVQAKREAFLRHYFKTVAPLVIATTPFLDFLQKNPWLEPYSLFKALKIATQWKSWEEWIPEWRDPSPSYFQTLLETHRDEILYHSLLQYFCFQQVEEVKRRSNAKGVWIKGDIPILIGRESSDVWHTRKYFDLDYSAGAPPDVFSSEGQNWGFPLYDWSSVEEQEYKFWKTRLKVAEQCYNIFRIDHIVGFFRIWGISHGKIPKEGRYLPSDPTQWFGHGEKLMQMLISNSSMLPIGEDLGVVPPIVKKCLTELGICGTKVLRWEREWGTGGHFTPIKDYSPISMTTVSTHDSETLQLWWRNKPEEARDYSAFKGWEYQETLTSDRHREILWDSHHSASLFHINLLQEYLAVIPNMTWPDPEDERINLPGSVSDRNWTYCFRPTLEEIISSEPLADLIRGLLPSSEEKI